jgi:hypothetical protein
MRDAGLRALDPVLSLLTSDNVAQGVTSYGPYQGRTITIGTDVDAYI